MKTALLTAALAAGFTTSAMAQDDFKWQAFYTQTYENVAKIADVWTAPSNQGGLSLVEEANGNHYVNYNHGNNNSRGLYNLDALTADMYNGIDEFDGVAAYRLEFDLALTSGSDQNTTFSVGSPDIQTMGKDWATPCGNITSYTNNGLGEGSLFSLIQDAKNSTYWRVYSQGPVGTNDYLTEDVEGVAENIDYRIDLASGTWYHFALTVTPAVDVEWSANVTAEVTDMDGNTVMFMKGEETMATITLPYTDKGNGYWFKQFYVLSGRYNSVMMMDNVLVMKKVAAGSVTPPTLSMTGVQMEGRIIALDNGAEADQLIPYYAIVDEATYESAESAEGLTGIEYTAPFVVSAEMNYILAWNLNENGKASELTKFTVEAGWAPQLNAPSISATDFTGRKKTYTATCDQSNVKPLAPLSYTIYMSADSINWTEGNTYTVTEGKVYAKVEAEGYAPAGCAPVEAPDGIYGSTKWVVAGMVVTNQDCILESTGETYLNFGNSGKGRVHVPVQYWSEDYVSEDGETTYDAENAWAPLKKNGFHFNGGTGDMFILGSGNANGFTVSGITVYNSNKGYIKIDNLTEGDIIQVNYADGSAQVLTVNDPETFTVPVPKYGGAALASIAIKGAGTVETREAKVGEWGIITSGRTVADVEKAGATFYEPVYVIYNDETRAADSLLLQPVNELQAGYAYIYKADADQIELVTLAAEEPLDEQADEQEEMYNYTFCAVLDDDENGYVDEGLYTMQPGGILMKNDAEQTIPFGKGYFTGLAEADNYAEELDFKLLPEYEAFIESVNKTVAEAEENWTSTGHLDEEENWIPDHLEDMTDAEKAELYATTYSTKLAALLDKYTVVPVKHEFNQDIADAIAKIQPKSEALVNVVTPAGVIVRRGVKASEALKGLKSGLYIVGSQKVAK